ncbi:hypothetical protein BV22DRAFT_1052355 [Leucogyrophana mollusca]|uniref:Uncharacterized protein n=1 Tax=Leucogyrophana mollusca TaxID=85980 RepID=A0ACB8AVY6_9AGAM|nr:hypothetical protein BV22DRAFT_1052355 [Leucogyrophana mollusca]
MSRETGDGLQALYKGFLERERLTDVDLTAGPGTFEVRVWISHCVGLTLFEARVAARLPAYCIPKLVLMVVPRAAAATASKRECLHSDSGVSTLPPIVYLPPAATPKSQPLLTYSYARRNPAFPYRRINNRTAKPPASILGRGRPSDRCIWDTSAIAMLMIAKDRISDEMVAQAAGESSRTQPYSIGSL